MRRFYLVAAGGLLGLEVAIALGVRDAWLRPYGGDVLATVLLYCAGRALAGGSVARALLGALLVSYLVELGQYVHLVTRLGLGGCRLAHVVLGSCFSGADLLAYTGGAAAVWGLEQWRHRRAAAR